MLYFKQTSSNLADEELMCFGLITPMATSSDYQSLNDNP